MDIGGDVRTYETSESLEIVASFEYVVSDLPELLTTPMMPVRAGEADVGGEVSGEWVVFQLHVRTWCPVVAREIEEVIEKVRSDAEDVSAVDANWYIAYFLILLLDFVRDREGGVLE